MTAPAFRVYHSPGVGSPFTLVPSAPDLSGKSGIVRLVGKAPEAVATRWGLALGTFAIRGGDVRQIR